MKNIFRFLREFSVHKCGLEFSTHSVMSDWKARERGRLRGFKTGCTRSG